MNATAVERQKRQQIVEKWKKRFNENPFVFVCA
jgi:hypothetical protein